MTAERFNIRVYGLLIKDGHLLVSDEMVGSSAMTKFPGGGLEFGEGIDECLYREFEEELDVKIKIGELFYINDFYQASAFDDREQLISIYYFVEQANAKEIPTAKKPFGFPPNIKQCFRWMEIEKIRQMDITYPVDQKVLSLLQEKFKKERVLK